MARQGHLWTLAIHDQDSVLHQVAALLLSELKVVAVVIVVKCHFHLLLIVFDRVIISTIRGHNFKDVIPQSYPELRAHKAVDNKVYRRVQQHQISEDI